MRDMNKKEKIQKLESKIILNKNLYYQGKPEISDFEYDRLEEELKELDPENHTLKIVGTTIFSTEKVEHSKKMLSLNKTYKQNEIDSWRNNEEVISTFKIDGSSCSIIYENGNIQIAKTRGDGRFGENITNKALFINHIPKRLDKNISLEVRGEVYCDESNFLLISDEMEKRGLEKPSSQRNIVAGILGRKENIDLSKFLSFSAFELYTNELSIKSEAEKFIVLKQLGFETPEYYLNKSRKDIEDRVNETQEFMATGSYLIDGIVFSYNNLDLHKELGETAHHPRYKLAFKFQGDTKDTKIKNISWQVSRNGYLTPVANVEPVELSGAKVSRVTLHNFGIVRHNKLKEGDIIHIVRSGEVIPKFLSVTESSPSTFSYPETCPSCNQKTIIDDIRLKCVNILCPAKLKDILLNYIQKIGIENLSSKRLDEVIKSGYVKDIPSLYKLKEEDLLSLDKVKEKLAKKIIQSITDSKNIDLITFLSALGITGGAYNKCEKIVLNGFDSIEKIMNMRHSELEMIESFAEKSASDFLNSLQAKKEVVNELLDLGVNPKYKKVTSSISTLNNEKFCITGTLSMKRSELQKLVKENGGQVQSSVNKETNYLITNDTSSTSSKFKKAQELKIKIINEDSFLSMINN